MQCGPIRLSERTDRIDRSARHVFGLICRIVLTHLLALSMGTVLKWQSLRVTCATLSFEDNPWSRLSSTLRDIVLVSAIQLPRFIVILHSCL